MLIAGQAANCRRVKAQSWGSADLPVDDGGQHLPLQPAQWRGLSQMKVLVQRARRLRDAQVDRESLIYPGYDAAVLPADPAEEELADPGDTLRTISSPTPTVFRHRLPGTVATASGVMTRDGGFRSLMPKRTQAASPATGEPGNSASAGLQSSATRSMNFLVLP